MTTLSIQSHRARSTLALALLTTIVLWASAFVAIRIALPAYGPQHLALMRFLVASLALGAYAAATRMGLPRRADLPRIIVCGLAGITVYNLLLNTGQQTVGAGAASLLVQTSPIWTALLATLTLGERLRPWGWLGILVSFGGAALIALGEGGGLQLSAGAALVLGAAVLLSLFSVLQKPLLARYSPAAVTTYAIWAGTIGLLPFAGSLAQTVAAAPLGSTLAVVFLGLGPAALAYVAWATVLSRLPAGRAASFLYLVPATALLLAWLLLGEAPHALSLAGGALALGGVVLVATSRGTI